MSKAVPILVITNVIAFGVAVMAFVKVDEISSQPSSKRQSARRDVASGDVQRLEAKVADLESKLSRASFLKSNPSSEIGVDAAGVEDAGKAIERSIPSVDGMPSGDGGFDADAVAASPGFEDFRKQVKLANEVNQKEDRINRAMSRMDELAGNARIGALSDKQKRKAAETLVGAQERSGLIWRGLMQREDLRSLPDDERRTAFREAYRTERDTIRTETQTELEGMMPAADAKVLMDQVGRMGDRGARRGRGR
ncbi:MAG: hypothetical protein AAGD14_06915 [Planctomycetota bacterium]